MVKRSYGGTALFPSYKKAKVMAQIKGYQSFKRPISLRPEVKTAVTTSIDRLYGGGAFSHYEKLLDGVAQGTDVSARIGRKIRLLSLEFDLLFTLGSSVVEYDAGFWSVIYDKRSNGAVPPIGDIFLYQGVNIGNAVLNEIGHPGRFTELARGDWTVGIAAGWNKKIHKKMSLSNKIVEYSGTGNTISSIDGGAIYLVYANIDRGTIFSDGTQARLITKIKYTDV